MGAVLKMKPNTIRLTIHNHWVLCQKEVPVTRIRKFTIQSNKKGFYETAKKAAESFFSKEKLVIGQ